MGENDFIVSIKNGKEKPEMATNFPTTYQEPNRLHDLRRKCDVILTPSHSIESLKKRRWPGLTQERVRKAANPSLHKKLDHAVENFSQEAWALFFPNDDKQLESAMSLINTYERVVLHEVGRALSPMHSPMVLVTSGLAGWLTSLV